MNRQNTKHILPPVYIVLLLCLICTCVSPVCAQESCYEQYLREHNITILTAEGADDSYEELKKEILARQMMQKEPLFQPLVLAIDTITSTCQLRAQDGTILANAHITMVDSTWYMWLSVDPLADKYPGNTPYLYCNGNPVMLVDPDGRDDYSIDENGLFRLEKRTADEFDRLGTLKEGTFDEDNFVTIRDKNLLSGILHSNIEQNGDNFVEGKYGASVATLFLFAATNTNVEWSMSGYIANGYRRYAVSTSHSSESVTPAYSAIGINEQKLQFTIHSHCREDGTKGASRYDPMYQTACDEININKMAWRFREYNLPLPNHYVYHTKSGELYHYTPYNLSEYIRTIKSYYSGLDFLYPSK